MITRDIANELLQSAQEYPVVTILGPRQSGKTTLARMTFTDKPYSSLEAPDVRLAAEADPREFLGRMEGGGILDEVQRLPSLVSYLQGMVDEGGGRGSFILDSHGNEVDLLIREERALTPVEIKSAGTFSPDFVKALEKFREMEIPRVAAGVVLYNGEQRLTVRGVRVFNPLLAEYLWDNLTSPRGGKPPEPPAKSTHETGIHTRHWNDRCGNDAHILPLL